VLQFRKKREVVSVEMNSVTTNSSGMGGVRTIEKTREEGEEKDIFSYHPIARK